MATLIHDVMGTVRARYRDHDLRLEGMACKGNASSSWVITISVRPYGVVIGANTGLISCYGA